MIEVCKPIIPRDTRPSWQTCSLIMRPKTEPPPHPYNKIMGEKLRSELHSAGLICFFHENPMPAEDRRLVHNMLFKKGFFLKSYSNTAVRLAITGTKFESAMPFTESRNALVISDTPDVKTLLKLTKKMPHFILLAGIAYDRFLSRDELEWLGTVPDVQYLLGQTCSLLSASASSLYSSTSYHQTKLSLLLASHSKQEGGDKKDDNPSV
ncbi:large ribosomal subunit protein uL10m-like isoform X2 [Ornithodoros turicata]